MRGAARRGAGSATFEATWSREMVVRRPSEHLAVVGLLLRNGGRSPWPRRIPTRHTEQGSRLYPSALHRKRLALVRFPHALRVVPLLDLLSFSAIRGAPTVRSTHGGRPHARHSELSACRRSEVVAAHTLPRAAFGNAGAPSIVQVASSFRLPCSSFMVRLCPHCGAPALRIHRRLIDHLISLVYPVRRYSCTRFECEWVGNLHTSTRERRHPA